VVEESKGQVASLAEAKLASLSQASREEHERQLAQVFQGQAEAMRQAAEKEVEWIKQAAAEAIVGLQEAGQSRETGLTARAGAAEERLAGVSLAVEALEGCVGAVVEEFQGRLESSLQAFQQKGARQTEELTKLAQGLGARWTQQFQEQAEAAVERLREEVKSSGRVVEESKRQVASLVETKLASLSQAAAKAEADLQAEQRRLKDQYETSRREHPETSSGGGWPNVPYPPVRREIPPRRRNMVLEFTVAGAVFLVVTTCVLGMSLRGTPVMRLQAEAPVDFVDQNPNWTAKRRAREEELAKAYWQVAVVSLQKEYRWGSELPAEPLSEFQIEKEKEYVPTGGAKAITETRAHYWEKLRRSWADPQCWIEREEGGPQWSARLRQIWDHLRGKVPVTSKFTSVNPPAGPLTLNSP
jgi:hypothetical protein